MALSENRCEVTISHAMKKDEGRWEFVIGYGESLVSLEKEHYLFDVFIEGIIYIL